MEIVDGDRVLGDYEEGYADFKLDAEDIDFSVAMIWLFPVSGV